MAESDNTELGRLRSQIVEDRKLLRRAEQTLAQIDRGPGLSDEHADVLAALRIRLEGKERASLEDLLGTVSDMSSKRDLADVLGEPEEKDSKDWPEVKDKPRDWPGL
jgi:hypothetical protein